jgi:hypothetical protein
MPTARYGEASQASIADAAGAVQASKACPVNRPGDAGAVVAASPLRVAKATVSVSASAAKPPTRRRTGGETRVCLRCFEVGRCVRGGG